MPAARDTTGWRSLTFTNPKGVFEMTCQASDPRLKARAHGRSVLGSRTVVIGCPDAARVATLKHAITARGPLTVAAAWPLRQALAAGRDADTAVVILESFPSSLELQAMADVTTAHPELAVLVLGPLEPNTEVLIALASGAAGYLPSASAPTAVAHAVEALLAGDIVFPRTVSLPLIHNLRWRGKGVVVTGIDRKAAELTNREWEVLVLLRQARSTAEIARRQAVATDTVRCHVAALVRKLDAHDRSTLTGSADTNEDRWSPAHRRRSLR